MNQFLRRSTCLIAASAICCASAQSAHATADGCLQYEPTMVTLHGVISEKSGFGPPGYGEDPEHDMKTSWDVVTLDNPICVDEKPSQFAMYPAETNVSELQILWDDGLPSHRDWFGKQMALTGTLYHQITAGNRTKVLIRERGGVVLDSK